MSERAVARSGAGRLRGELAPKVVRVLLFVGCAFSAVGLSACGATDERNATLDSTLHRLPTSTAS